MTEPERGRLLESHRPLSFTLSFYAVSHLLKFQEEDVSLLEPDGGDSYRLPVTSGCISTSSPILLLPV